MACRHKWDRDGERCEKCGAKDWLIGGFSAHAAKCQDPELHEVRPCDCPAPHSGGGEEESK